MGNELVATPGAGDGSQGQAADEREPIDFSKTAEGRAFMSAVQSTAERQANEERHKREQAEKRAVEAEARADQVSAQYETVIDTVRQADPEAHKLIVSEATRAGTEAELKHLRQQMEEAKQREADASQAQDSYREFFTGWNNYAVSAGVNPSEPEFQNALQQAYASGDGTVAMNAIVRLAAKKQNAPDSTPEPDFVSPPSGGSPGPKRLNEVERERLYGELYELKRNPTQNKIKIVELEKRLQQ